MTINDACQMTNGYLQTRTPSTRRIRGVSIDTRTLKRGNAFFCLRGVNTDGHRFASAACEGGAGAIVADRSIAKKWSDWPCPVIGVDDPLAALGDLAVAYDSLFPTRYVAVTGSVGKTTTKELAAAALSSRFRVYKSPGNYNNLIGIPLALLARNQKVGSKQRVGVLEFGMSTPGEIARLSEMIQPEWGVVTQIAPSHTMQLKTLAGVARAKRELFDFARPDTVAFLNADDSFQRRWMAKWDRPTITYSLKGEADFVADNISVDSQGRTTFRVNRRHAFRLNLPGEHNVRNALAAISVARQFRIPFADIAASLRKVKPEGSRSRVERLGAITLLDDCYNASPASMTAALHTLKAWPNATRRIAVLGAMRELGREEVSWHRRIGKIAAQSADLIVTVGDLAREIATGSGTSSTKTFRTKKQAIAYLERVLSSGDVVLLKASNSERFNDIGDALRERHHQAK